MSKFVIILLDKEDSHRQKNIWYLSVEMELIDIATKFGISSKLRRLLGRRWEIYMNKTDSMRSLTNVYVSVVSLMKNMITFLEGHDEKSIIIPPNITNGII